MVWFPSAIIALVASSVIPVTAVEQVTSGQTAKIAPKVFIFSMYERERDAWFNIPEFNILDNNITVRGFSPLFPQAHCTRDGSICELVTGEAEINAVATVSALLYSPIFDLHQTYFLIAGIAGGSPKLVTTGSVTFARYAVQVALQHEIDAREISSDWPTGYFPQGVKLPNVFEYPQAIYGTEVFEVNDNLRQLAFGFAKAAILNDTAAAQAYRANYANVTAYAAGASPPSFVLCDTATTDQYWAGDLLAEAFENTTTLFTNGTGVYCTSQQEDNATLEALLRGAVSGLVDFSRIIIMRTVSDIDRPYEGQTAVDGLLTNQNGHNIALNNIPIAGVKVIQGIIDHWNHTFKTGVKPDNYIGDIFGSLGGEPDFGPGSVFNDSGALSVRSVGLKKGSRRVWRE